METVYANWGGNPVKLTWIPNMISDGVVITSVHGVCLDNGKILLSNIAGRGFSLPGGHMENDETPEQTLHREIYEEAYVRGHLTYLGCIEVSHEENPNFNPYGKYPMVAFQAFYRVDVTECLPFLREFEANTRIWVEHTEVNYVMEDHALALHIIESALNL